MRTIQCALLLILTILTTAIIAAAEVGDIPKGYKLQKEDIIYIVLWGDQTITNKYAVDPEGNIQVPLIPDPVHVEGLTQSEVVQVLKEKLKRYYQDPQIQVVVIEFHRRLASVLGQVMRPGVHEIKDGDHVMELIAQAGSFTQMADLKMATITRRGSNQAEPLDLYALFYQGDMSKNVEVKPGDVIYIPEATTNRFFVLGEVYRPGQYQFKENMTIMDAISNASGPTQRASLKKVTIIRGDPNKPERIEIDMNKVLKEGDLSGVVALKPGDVVYVPETSKPDWNKLSAVVSSLVNTTYLFRILGF